eukprot:TRINITY_DN27782_c0_g2_i2.p1 TRINITY_DN27782_c0_g2~~TRINITY_DN27782_c0_g2_i2.p1  ORF type:complete len:1767 (+),score=455.48 TRINITY_DN27782_c0_g2_i2:361-5301(+)
MGASSDGLTGLAAMPTLGPGPSPEVVQALEENFLHVLDILEIIISGNRQSPKWLEYSSLVADASHAGSVDYPRLFSAVGILFDLLKSSLHRFAQKIVEFLQSATRKADFQPDCSRCWQRFVQSAGMKRLAPLVPAIAGELLRFAERLKRKWPEDYKELCTGLITDIVEKACEQHGDIVPLLPELPHWPELAKARAAMEKAAAQGAGQRDASFAARLEASIKRMESPSPQAAKSATLLHLVHLVGEQRKTAPKNIAELSPVLLARLMHALLQFLWASETSWPADELKCGELLGALGAVDPRTLAPHLNLSGGNSGSRSSSSGGSRAPQDLGIGKLSLDALAKKVLTDFLAPNLTSRNAYAFSAQEILKYLQKGATVSDINDVVPNLEEDIRETLRPYMQSSYQLIQPVQASADTSGFVDVVKQAVRLVQPKDKQFFEACLPALESNHGLALFLMHHLLHFVLESATAGLEDLANLSRSFAKLLDTSADATLQAVFALVDDLSQRRDQQQREVARLQGNPVDVNRVRRLVQRIDELMRSISPRKVVAASLRCSAHARALQFLERALIDENPDVSAVFDKPQLRSEDDCLLMQKVYRELQESDGVLGALRVGPSTSRTRTLQLEQTGRWHDVLSCYEEQLASSSASRSTQLAEAETVPAPLGSLGLGLGASSTAGECSSRLAGALPSLSGPEQQKRQELLLGMVRCNQKLRRFESSLRLINGMEDDASMNERLRPLAVEAAWQLGSWKGLKKTLAKPGNDDAGCVPMEVEESLPPLDKAVEVDDVFQLGLGQAMLAFHERRQEVFSKVIHDTTLQVTRAAASAARESYHRAYKHVLKLHVLSDLKWLWGKTDKRLGRVSGEHVAGSLAGNFLERLEATSPTFTARQEILSPLRVALIDLELVEDAKQVELAFVRLWRKHRAEVPIAMEHPSTSFSQASPQLLLQAQLEWGKLLYQRGARHEALQQMQQLALRHPKARLLGTRWATEASSELLIPRVAEAEFLQAKEHLPDNEAAYFYHAAYLDQLLKEQMTQKAQGGAPASGTSASATPAADARKQPACPFDLKNLVVFTLRGYLQALQRGNKRMHFTLNRVLQLAWDCAELDFFKQEAMAEIQRQAKQMQVWMWYCVMTQLMSRIHNKSMKELFSALVLDIFFAYPEQASWHLLQLLQANNSERRQLGNSLSMAISRKNKEVHKILNRYYEIGNLLVTLANHIPSADTGTMNLDAHFKDLVNPGKNKREFLVPLQSQTTAEVPRMRSQKETQARFDPFPEKVMTDRTMSNVDVFRTKEKPKKVTFLGTDGRQYPFLCKAERRGDLRKDSRMMELGAMVNRMLQRNPETSRRNLEVRTFNVVIFNESSGLIEWVPKTRGLRHIIDDLWRHTRPGHAHQSVREIKLILDASKDLYQSFTRQILPRHPPVLHHWFMLGTDPATWLSKRLAFSRSQALWCMIGYVVGLGDRHGENILVDTESGRMVHVDFDCLFGKGMQLERPETVPFRLTQNCVAALGVTGVEGVFRQACELCMQVLRDQTNRQTLLSVLHAFIADPLIEWGSRSSKAQEREEQKVQQARSTIGEVEKKLNGMLNVGADVSCLGKRLERDSVISKEEREKSLLGRDRGVGLSVAGQVDELLKAAMCKYNLSEMYVGWQPWC